MIHSDSNLGFWNSLSRSLLIYFRDLVCPASAITLYFIYHVRDLSLKEVSSCAIFNTSSVIVFTNHIASHVNQCCFKSSLPIPWNTCSLKFLSWFAILNLVLFPPDWSLVIGDMDTDIETLPRKVFLTSTSSSLVSPLLLSSTLSYSTPISLLDRPWLVTVDAFISYRSGEMTISNGTQSQKLIPFPLALHSALVDTWTSKRSTRANWRTNFNPILGWFSMHWISSIFP